MSTSTRTFTEVAAKRMERHRYEVDNDDGYIGQVFTFHDSKAAPSKRVWFAELEGEVVGTAPTRYGAARLLGVGRDVPHQKVPRRRHDPTVDLAVRKLYGPQASLFDDDGALTFQVVQPVVLLGGMPSGRGDKPTAKPERVKAAAKVLADHADVLDAAGVTAKVGKDGFVHMSPLALERLLNIVTAAKAVTA